MKISIEFKDKKYTVTYGRLSAIGATPAEAVANLVAKFGEEVKKFFAV